jgi:hypothetical protein
MKQLGITFLTLLLFLNTDGYPQQRENLNRPLTGSGNQTSPLSEIATALTIQSFENAQFPPAGWQKVTNFSGTGWQRGEAGTQVPGFTATDILDAPPTGGNFIAYVSWATGDADGHFNTGQATDQWLITPKIESVQPGDSLKFSLRYFSRFSDNLDVLISTRGDSIADFDTVVATLKFRGAGNNEWQSYAYALTDFVPADSSIYVAFREHVDNTANVGDALFLDLVEVVSLVTGVTESPVAPGRFELEQNYPNPFNPSTEIAFTLPQSDEVFLRVYNLLGQEVATILNGVSYPAGRQRVLFNAGNLPNGIFFYKLEAGSFVEVKKMTLLR